MDADRAAVRLPEEHQIRVEDASVSFGKEQVLKGVSFTIERGRIVGLVAPNGVGKTTLLRTICGLEPQPKGCVLIDGASPETPALFKKKFFFIEDVQVLNPELSAYDYLKYVKRMWHSDVDIKMTVDTLRIARFIKKPIKALSLGMKQQVVLALCLVSDAPYILLDEPMNGLDPTNTRIISQQLTRIRDCNKTVLMSSHLLGNIDALADEVLFIKGGGIAHRSTREDGMKAADIYERLYLS
ncbi:MAG: ATP-binding cassette domain-containing protein [Coriobacteriales bacterium]|nr:ATP-binding cassette domain-containing protein [Coriobacteriales bacterium]